MLLYAQLIILVILAVLNVWFGVDKGLYDIIWWWDIPTHFLGGVWVGLFTTWVLVGWKMPTTLTRAALGALCVGLVWEVFELYVGVGGSLFMPYWLDTLKDLFIDTLGGTIAGYALMLEKSLWQK